MTRESGQIAEYGSSEFQNNQSVFTSLEKGLHINSCNISFECELYHRTEGYKPAGSCAIWTKEVWGYRIFQHDGTITGRMFLTKDEALENWKRVNNGTKRHDWNKYQVVNPKHPMTGKIFSGHKIVINDENRIFDNGTVGNSYLEIDCVLLEERK